MTEESSIKLFRQKTIRSEWDEDNAKWYFAIIDVVAALVDTPNPNDYLKKIKKRDSELAKAWGQFVTPLSMPTDGGMQKINCADTEGIFRLVQSIPSKKAEPFKLWLAQVGRERLDEIADPELSSFASPFPELKNTAEEDEALLYEYIKQHGGVSISIATRIVGGISRRTVQRRLNSMVDKKMIKIVGATNNLKYVLYEDKNPQQ